MFAKLLMKKFLSIIISAFFVSLSITIASAEEVLSIEQYDSRINNLEKRIARFESPRFQHLDNRLLLIMKTRLNQLLALRFTALRKLEEVEMAKEAEAQRILTRKSKKKALREKLLRARRLLVLQDNEGKSEAEHELASSGNTLEASVLELPEHTHDSDDSDTEESWIEYGIASYYADFFEDRNMATGIPFSNSRVDGVFFAAHREMPFGSVVKVTNLDNGQWVLVTILDRGPYADTTRRIIDLPRDAFAIISPLSRGIINVKIELVRTDDY
jgi:rare lipoprotein A